MNSPENQKIDQRLQELESQINQTPPSLNAEPGQPLERQQQDDQEIYKTLNKITDWFNGLPSTAKVIVIVVAALVGFSLLRTVFQLVASLFSLAVLGVLLYLVYKFWIAPQPRQ